MQVLVACPKQGFRRKPNHCQQTRIHEAVVRRLRMAFSLGSDPPNSASRFALSR